MASQRYVALYIGRDPKAAYTRALKAVPDLTVLSTRNAPLFEIEATPAAARRVNAMPGWTASVPTMLFESPSPFPPGFPQARPSVTRAVARPMPARITARRARNA